MTIPVGWMALRVGEEEYNKAFTSDVILANPALSDRLTQIQDADLKTFRLDALDIRDGHIPHGVFSRHQRDVSARRYTKPRAMVESRRKYPKTF